MERTPQNKGYRAMTLFCFFFLGVFSDIDLRLIYISLCNILNENNGHAFHGYYNINRTTIS